jgi:hypothetical protein
MRSNYAAKVSVDVEISYVGEDGKPGKTSCLDTLKSGETKASMGNWFPPKVKLTGIICKSARVESSASGRTINEPVSTSKKNDMDLVIGALFSKMKPGSTGYCARAINDALRAAGTEIPVVYKNENGKWSRPDASRLGWFLERAGFHQLPAASYAPEAFRGGDIVVFQPIAGHPHGHVAVYNEVLGQWMSDFLQKSFNVDRHGGYNTGLYSIYRK